MNNTTIQNGLSGKGKVRTPNTIITPEEDCIQIELLENAVVTTIRIPREMIEKALSEGKQVQFVQKSKSL